MLGRTRHVHFVGIGGIGMSGIAELLVNLGYAVSGSDAKRSELTDRLETLGVTIAIGHDRQHLHSPDVVVVSSAVAADNPEVVEARAQRIPVIPRAEMLAELMRLRFGIAIAGSHGKTTTTSMVALMLERAGLDPTAVIGGRLSAFGSNARLGRGPYMVAEADESDRSFLKLSPAIAVITNIDREHMEAYGSFDRLVDAFAAFADRVPFYGAVIACADDDGVADVSARCSRRVIPYGFSDHALVRGADPVTDGHSAQCVMSAPALSSDASPVTGTIRLGVPGHHNLLNALAATAVGLELGIPFDQIAAALAEFRGAERRYQTRGIVHGITVVDDYGHHPTEIAAVLHAARAGKPRRVLAVFQPHRYTRTHDLLDDFGPALALADVVVLTDIYAAGEPPIPGITLDRLAEAVRQHASEVHVVRRLEDVPSVVAGLASPDDLILTMGAGSIGSAGDRILAAITELDATTDAGRVAP